MWMHRHWRMQIRRGSTVIYVNTRWEIPQIRLFVEDLVINLSEDTGVGAEGGRNVFVLGEEAYCPSEEAVEDFCVDQFPQAGHVGGGEDEHVAELTGKGISSCSTIQDSVGTYAWAVPKILVTTNRCPPT